MRGNEIGSNAHHHLFELAHVHPGEVGTEGGVVLGVLRGGSGRRGVSDDPRAIEIGHFFPRSSTGARKGESGRTTGESAVEVSSSRSGTSSGSSSSILGPIFVVFRALVSGSQKRSAAHFPETLGLGAGIHQIGQPRSL